MICPSCRKGTFAQRPHSYRCTRCGYTIRGEKEVVNLNKQDN